MQLEIKFKRPRPNSQNGQVLAYLERGFAITPREASQLFGCDRLAARIWELRHIYGMPVKERNVHRNDKNFSEYYL